jgi:hypothetical protein
VAGDLIEDGWKKIGAECADFHNVGVLPPGLNATEVCSLEVKNLRHFMEQSVEPVDGNPLDYYRANNTNLAIWCGKGLSVVRMLLAVPAGESHCERASSWAHGFITRLRTRTSHQTLEMEMVLYDLFRQEGFDWEAFLMKISENGSLNGYVDG